MATSNRLFVVGGNAVRVASMILVVLTAACEDDEPAQVGGTGMPPGDASAPDLPAADVNSVPEAAPLPPPLYAIANEVYDTTSSTTYVSIVNTLDFKEIDLKKAREYPGGRATIATINGWLFVAAPESPVVTRFAVAQDGTSTEDGKLSFASFGIKAVGLDDWSITLLSPTKAYLLNYEEGNTIVWNPTTLEITGEIKPPDIAPEDLADLDGSPAVVHGNRLYRIFFRMDWMKYTWSKDQYLAVYDTDNDQLLELVKETRCPALNNRVSTDEQGFVYFNNWIWNVSATLVNGAPRSCALRMDPRAGQLDATWTLPYADVTGGREASNLTYIGKGQALLSVFHQERATINAMTDPSELAGTQNWRLWKVDLDKRTGAPLEGVDWNTGATSIFNLDGRSFAFVPAAGWAATTAYEIKDGKATEAFTVKGWSYSFFKVR